MSRKIVCRRTTESGKVLQIVHGDLTREATDAIVNAANEHLAHGGGVAGAIVRAGGQVIQTESHDWIRTHGQVPTGAAAITGAGRLPAKYVIHAVGPVWRGGNNGEEGELASAVRSALKLADDCGLCSISLPAISSGIFGYPKKLCARTMIFAVDEFWRDYPGTTLEEINLVHLDRRSADLFCEESRSK